MSEDGPTIHQGDTETGLSQQDRIARYAELVEALPNEGLDWNFSKHVNILLILLGERPAAEVKFREASRWTWEPVLKEIGLSWVEEDKGSWSVLWITDEPDRIDKFDIGEDAGEWGLFLGYPEFAVEAFEEQEEPSAKYLRENFPENAGIPYHEYKKQSWLVNYVPPATKEGVDSRLATQNSYESALESCGVESVENAFDFARRYHESSGLTKAKLTTKLFIKMVWS